MKNRKKHTDEVARRGKAVLLLSIAALLLLLSSCISFDIGDWPSRYVHPHNIQTKNWCGTIGAFCAYYLLYYIGPGIFVCITALIGLLVTKLFNKALDQLALRIIGLTLLTTAASSSFYFFWPKAIYSFGFGSGGVLGVAVTVLLQNQFALLGTFILLSATWLVGVILLADNLFTNLFRVLIKLTLVLGFLKPLFSYARKSSKIFTALRGSLHSTRGQIWGKLRKKQKPLIPINHIPAASIGIVKSETPATKPEETKERISMETGLSEPGSDGQCRDYAMPPLELLAESEHGFTAIQETIVKSKAKTLENLLGEFNINAQVVAAETGPVITMFELELAAGVKVSQISNLSNDMARALGAGAVRVVAPLAGKHTIGIEVPNSEKEKVRIKDMILLAGNKPQRMQIPLFLGKDSSGDPLVSDLTKMPHLLIAGKKKKKKSICINSIITAICLTKRPDEVKMILIDPKMVEMTTFNTIPHLMCPIVTETKRAVKILEWATVKMDERYSLLAEARVKNISDYNKLGTEKIIERFNPISPEEEAKIPKKIPHIVIVIDELADLMMTAAKEIESYIVRLAQKSRAIGIHLVIATQRPQATVVTGLIKSNMPTRIGFRVAARMDSRIILDQNGAETLLGEGDMLFLKPGTSDLIRAQGTFVDEAEAKRIVKYLKDVAEPQFHPELTQLRRIDISEANQDELFEEAVRIILETHRGSVSLLQRRLNIGYARASRIIETMASVGVLGEYKGSQAREILMTAEEYEETKKQSRSTPSEHNPQEQQTEQQPSQTCLEEGQRGYVSLDSQDQ